MKKKFASVLVLALLLSLICSCACAISHYFVKSNNGGNVNVRRWPDKNAEIIGSLPYGDEVSVQYFDGSWACIVYGSYGDAYVSSQYLVDYDPGRYSPTPSRRDDHSSPEFYANARLRNSIFDGFYRSSGSAIASPQPRSSFVNLRWAPSKEAKVIGICYYGHRLRILQENRSWMQVLDEENGVAGFIMKDYVQYR